MFQSCLLSPPVFPSCAGPSSTQSHYLDLGKGDIRGIEQLGQEHQPWFTWCSLSCRQRGRVLPSQHGCPALPQPMTREDWPLVRSTRSLSVPFEGLPGALLSPRPSPPVRAEAVGWSPGWRSGFEWGSEESVLYEGRVGKGDIMGKSS